MDLLSQLIIQVSSKDMDSIPKGSEFPNTKSLFRLLICKPHINILCIYRHIPDLGTLDSWSYGISSIGGHNKIPGRKSEPYNPMLNMTPLILEIDCSCHMIQIQYLQELPQSQYNMVPYFE